MPSVPLVFFFVALVILIGFVTSRIFQTTRFPDIPLLLCLGLVIGPLNREAFALGWGSAFLVENINVDTLKEFAPFVSTLALIVILFDSGIKLDFSQFSRSMRPAFIHTLPTFIATVLFIAIIANYVFGMTPLLSVILGVALSNVGQTVSAAIIREMSFDQDVRSIYFIEMAIYDLVSIPIIVSLLEFAQGAGEFSESGLIVQSLIQIVSISLLLGLAGGLIWVWVMLRLQHYAYSYMVTLASLLLVFSLNSFLGGSGPVSVLIFGLVVGNRQSVLRMFGKEFHVVPEGDRVHRFHDEITFFVRSFFFIFLGITFSTGMAKEWTVNTNIPALDIINHTAALFLLGVALIVASIVIARVAVVRLISARNHPARRGLITVYGRGLGTAVLATYPFTIAAYEPGTPYHDLFRPWETVFINTALLVILLTVVLSALQAWWREKDGVAAAAVADRIAVAKE